MKRIGLLASVALLMLPLVGCQDAPASNKVTQAQKAAEAAQSINFEENAEIENIKRRLELTADPGKIGFILLMNAAGQPIMYEGVKGKITSGSKRLTSPQKALGNGNGGYGAVVATPSDEGTWGSSSPYVFYWNTDGVYRQWDGNYLYSDQPIRTRVEPLVINVTAGAAK
jgi:hypothetical protein